MRKSLAEEIILKQTKEQASDDLSYLNIESMNNSKQFMSNRGAVNEFEQRQIKNYDL